MTDGRPSLAPLYASCGTLWNIEATRDITNYKRIMGASRSSARDSIPHQMKVSDFLGLMLQIDRHIDM